MIIQDRYVHNLPHLQCGSAELAEPIQCSNAMASRQTNQSGRNRYGTPEVVEPRMQVGSYVPGCLVSGEETVPISAKWVPHPFPSVGKGWEPPVSEDGFTDL